MRLQQAIGFITEIGKVFRQIAQDWKRHVKLLNFASTEILDVQDVFLNGLVGEGRIGVCKNRKPMFTQEA